jgi:hypothetical protein
MKETETRAIETVARLRRAGPNDIDGTSLSPQQQRCSIHAVAGGALTRIRVGGMRVPGRVRLT